MCLNKYNKVRFSLKFSMNVVMCLAAMFMLFCIFSIDHTAAEKAICARVRIQLSQDVVIARNAFKATLAITNSPENVPLENLTVILDITDENDQPVNNLFGIHPPELSGVDDVDGTGIIQPGTTAIASWLIVPTRDAAPNGPVMYYVGGEFSYTQGDSTITMPLFPAPILVKPDPFLTLDYFWVKDVYGDDPFTSEIEPSEPFPLGLRVKNDGKGVANDFRIVSSQPQIIENEKGLLVDFKIIGAQVNFDPVSPSLSLNLGDIDPGSTSIAMWWMTSSLQGQFIEYDATFTHIDGLGNPRLSLIDTVNIHELIHVVRVDEPDDDSIPDFLAKDEDTYRVYESTSIDTAVTDQSDSSTLTFVKDNGPESTYTLETTASTGFIYVELSDPFNGQKAIKEVVRSDGKIIRPENIWLSRTRIENDPWQYFFNLFDAETTGSYTVIFTTDLVCTDKDGDGYFFGGEACGPVDCDDDPITGTDINPGASEICDGIDNNCDEAIDEGGNALCDDANPCTVNSCNGLNGCVTDSYLMDGTVCRASLGFCDIAETCQGGECPSDSKSTSECRSSAGICDVAEVCDGASNDCPDDSYQPATEVCRVAAGACDLTETCTGISAECPADAKSAAECRSSAGVCDVAEVCDGASNDCPDDSYQPATKICRAVTGVCDLEETCTGNSAECPDDSYQPDTSSCDDEDFCTEGTTCTAGVCGGGSVPDEVCDGMGVIVPAYFYPSWWDSSVNFWDDLIDAAQQIPIIAIMNPNSGPGDSRNSDYVHEVDALRLVRGKVIGYVHTSYGNRTPDDCKDEVDKYYDWYNMDGIFFDEMSSDPSKFNYYKELYDYVICKGGIVVSNPGTNTDEIYLDAATILVVSEGNGDNYPGWSPPSWIGYYPPSSFSNLVYGLSNESTLEDYINSAKNRNIGWIYITDDILPNPWDTLPDYWEQFIDLCKGEDNNCDGEINEGFNFGELCSVGGGTCQATGFIMCSADGLSTDCGGTEEGPRCDEVCDGQDNDCNGMVDDGLTTDADGDQHSTPNSCKGTRDDCDDADPNNFPGNIEICDSQDNDCDDLIDEDLTTDNDKDQHSTPDSCKGTKDDCDDTDPNNFPGNTEVCDGKDNNCDNQVDNNEAVTYCDQFDSCNDTGTIYGGGSCMSSDYSCVEGSCVATATSGTDTCGGDAANPSVTYYSCYGGNSCQVAETSCDDNVGCTDDSCDEISNRCTNTVNNDNCNDNKVCTEDICDSVDNCLNPVIPGCPENLLDDLKEIINDPQFFTKWFKGGKDNRRTPLSNKIDEVNAMIQAAKTETDPTLRAQLKQEILDKLNNDLLAKTDGCAKSNWQLPDNNDWIVECGDPIGECRGQCLIYHAVLDIIDGVQDNL